MRNANLLSSREALQAALNNKTYELHQAQMRILELIPSHLSQILSSYKSSVSVDSTKYWEEEIAERLIEQSTRLSNVEGTYLYERAYCPLCGAGSTSPGDTGYSIPEGLRRHLKGWGRKPRCYYFNLASELAQKYWDEKFNVSSIYMNLLTDR